MNGLGLYARYVGVSFRSQMQYKASFLLSSVSAFLVSFVEVLDLDIVRPGWRPDRLDVGAGMPFRRICEHDVCGG